MGAGAGYTLQVKDVQITGDIQIISFGKLKEEDFSVFHYDVIGIECIVPITGSVKADSYMYGCNWIEDVPMSVTKLNINVDRGTEITEAEISDILNNPANYAGEGTYGGGWSHSTFDGVFSINPKGDYIDDVEDVTLSIANQNLINFIDLAVQGENKEYDVIFNGDAFEGYETQDEAIDALDAMIRDEITANGIDSVDFSSCYVEELYWEEDAEGNQDILDPWYDNIVYKVYPEDFSDYSEAVDEFGEEMNPATDIGEDFDI